MTTGSPPDPHDRHDPGAWGAPPRGGYGVVVGNCQAESVRIVLDSEALPLVRVPPVFELDAGATRRLHELVAGASALIAQPVKDDYHGLPLGTRQLAASLPASGRAVTFPVVRYTGLHPFQAALHVPGVEETPPIVAYHDIRTLAEAAGIPVQERLTRDAVHAEAADSIAELRRREASLDVAVSDVFAVPRFDLVRTVNHPGNEVILAIGERVLRALGRGGAAVDPGRRLLNDVHAPREPWVIEAWGLEDEAAPAWDVAGRTVGAAEVHEAHLEWYRENPAFVRGAIERLRPTLARWRR
ncbi:peptide ABC transporter ATPase [Microbacterium sp. EYE_5]|uniref:WcbI family polysaccharide biosynthesis putative acetyltransferase n=1 Tax=unclassified Microbacterium TaxID=2609290 RepID=UPI002005EC2F|nr:MULTISPECIES: WcbI family polysaccharide biosynthesis putative acetyltransferase [unclassified Microbacterium]MCK6079244.1 peptide ABC transporter ATPase [Microbacterium sp. EYE_382]MCK6084514.1 peptide ABC transporter ATPase [Microbacterium sp. EYE_384]MCK6123257.1 peptide ABC transporter ATPase [Microbacterium sp. EYE_80]MCK6125278.1 peptide ABC transporter ATPase [Microbacterium sp. EYE_79]MCK6140198.1 peptide ABC transporter ATPase [Microbacterium sp. EYE_39]